jgi:hypothetical protein
MRIIALVVLLALAGASEAADWTEWADWLVGKNTFGELVVVNREPAFTVYANVGTLRSADGVVTMWSLTDFTLDKEAVPVKGSMSLRIEREYDCNRSRMRSLYFSRHAKNMGEGEIVASDSTAGAWQPVMLGTIGERLWKVACGRR